MKPPLWARGPLLRAWLRRTKPLRRDEREWCSDDDTHWFYGWAGKCVFCDLTIPDLARAETFIDSPEYTVDVICPKCKTAQAAFLNVAKKKDHAMIFPHQIGGKRCPGSDREVPGHVA